MADKRITELNLHTSITLSDVIPIVNSNETKKLAYGTIYNNIRADLATTGSNIFIGDQTITGSINMSGSLSSPEWIDFKTDNDVPNQVARQWWDPTTQTMVIGMNNDVILNLGQETHYPICVNGDTGTILNGTLVMADPTGPVQGQRLKVVRAITDGTYDPQLLVGVATQDILENEAGYVTWFGAVRDVKTTDLESAGIKNPSETWVSGNILYGDPTRPGGLTNVKPSAPNLKSTIAIITTVNGINANLLVRPTLGPRLLDIHDIHSNEGLQGELLSYDASEGHYNLGTELSGSYGITGSLDVQGSVSVSDVLNLPPQDPLPSGTIGDLAVSGSNLYFYNGTWTQIV